MSNVVIKIENLKKQYKLGTIGGQTLTAELQSWWARKRGKEDPNLLIGQDYSNCGERFLALNGINLEIQRGDALGIIGGNGAGKSTLLKILSRITSPTEGDIWINGRISSMLEVGTGFHGELTGRENIYMNGAILGMSKKEVDAKLESIIEFSECRQFIDTPVKRYSSGMYVKLAFAVASHLDSEIMVMDEVLAVGDMKFQKKCLGKMGNAAQSEGKTVLYVSHNMATIRALCTRCIVLDKGQLIFDGDVEEAINIYLDADKTNLISEYNLDNEPRAVYGLGNDFHICFLRFYDKDYPIYTTYEKIKIEITCHHQSIYIDVRIFIHLFSAQTGVSVGLTTSELISTQDEIQKFELDISQLSEGIYYFEIGGMRLLPNGQHITLDRVKKRIYFQVIRENNNEMPMWNNNIYGNMVFPHMKKV